MLHHISIFYALLAANVIIQTVTLFLLSMLNWYLQVSHMLSCDYYSQICSCWSHVILGTIFMNCGLLHNSHLQMFCILLGAVHIVCTFLVKCILKYISMCNVECYVLLQVISFSQNEISVETAAFMQQIWLYWYSSSNITYSHNCLFYVPQLWHHELSHNVAIPCPQWQWHQSYHRCDYLMCYNGNIISHLMKWSSLNHIGQNRSAMITSSWFFSLLL